MVVLFLVLAAFLALFAVLVQRGGGFGFPWIQFYVKGKESGFKLRELNLLRRVALESRLRNPTSLFWSERQLDRCIRNLIVKYRALGKERDPATVMFLSKLFEFRKRVEFNLPKYRLGIQSSRTIVPRQILRITFPAGGGVFQSQVVENMRRYLAISYPKGRLLPPGFSWQGQRINVYFWRNEDAGYYFDSKVVGDYLDRKYPILHISHSDNLIRSQKRRSVRAATSVPVGIYPLRAISAANEAVESSNGYRGRMMDVSEDGAAVVVGGRAKPGLPLKLQFTLGDEVIVLCGVVKGITHNQKTNQSIMHMQAAEPSPLMKNKILTYVYGIFREPEGQASPAPVQAAHERMLSEEPEITIDTGKG